MRKVLKVVALSLGGLLLVGAIGLGLFIYKIRYGFNTYETEPPTLPTDLQDAVLVFSKTNGFRHGEAIAASLPTFEKMAADQGWPLFVSDNGAVFNPEQLARFRVVVWNNTSGKVLNEAQRDAFRRYLEGGGGYVGIHASGDNSHHWDWYEQEVIGAHFSHHPLHPQLQTATMYLEADAADTQLAPALPARWKREEEWYIFYDNPRARGSQVLFTVDESTIKPSGNVPLLATDKDWGMGDDHPIVWSHAVGAGRAFYSALGHQGAAFQEPEHLQLLENAIRWAGRLD